MKNLIVRFRNSNIRIQILYSLASLLFYGFASTLLNASYSRSKFPVPYFIGQTSFDAAKIKMWYQFMIQTGTFHIYFNTQLIDFLFIVSVILGGFFIWTLIARLHSANSFFRSWGYAFAFLLPFACLFDILENLVSFFMIADPLHFPDALALVHSTFATIKFGFWGLALLWLFISLIALPIGKFKHAV